MFLLKYEVNASLSHCYSIFLFNKIESQYIFLCVIKLYNNIMCIINYYLIQLMLLMINLIRSPELKLMSGLKSLTGLII